MNTPPCVFIVDDDEAVRDGLEMVIEMAGMTCKTFESAENFLDCYRPDTPGCLVLDINMPGMKGEDLQLELINRNIHLPIIFLTSYGDIPMSVRTIKAGAVDFLTKPVNIDYLLSRIREELEQGAQDEEKNKEVLEIQKRLNTLTPREKDVLPLTIEGISNKEIAQRLGISFRTVELHRTNILRKTGAANFLELSKQCQQINYSFSSTKDKHS